MYREILVALALLQSAAVQAEKLVPFKMDVPPVCGFQGIQFPENVVVLGAIGHGGKPVGFQIDQSGHIAKRIDVAVNYPGIPVALMLEAYEPTIWNIGWTAETKIIAVFVGGYERQRVAGLSKDTPLLVSSYVDKGPCNETGSFRYDDSTDVTWLTSEQTLSRFLYAQPISKMYSVVEGKAIIGNPIERTQALVTSPDTPPESFHDKSAPLAGKAGLEEAMRKKVIRQATLNDARNWLAAIKKKYAVQHLPPPDIPPDLDNAYVVLKKFIYPGGLFGADSATFYIPEGVPRPLGDPGHSRVYDLNSITLECSAESACGEAMRSGVIGKSKKKAATSNTSSSPPDGVTSSTTVNFPAMATGTFDCDDPIYSEVEKVVIGSVSHSLSNPHPLRRCKSVKAGGGK